MNLRDILHRILRDKRGVNSSESAQTQRTYRGPNLPVQEFPEQANPPRGQYQGRLDYSNNPGGRPVLSDSTATAWVVDNSPQFIDASWVPNPPENQRFQLGYTDSGSTGWEPQTEPSGTAQIHNCTANLGEPDVQGPPMSRYQIAKNQFPTNRYTIARDKVSRSKN